MNIITRFVTTVYLHLHLDEVWALYMVLKFGQTRLENLEKAKLEFHTDLPHLSPEEWARRQELVLGGGGDFSDEHISGIRHARIPDASAASLTYQYLEIDYSVIKVLTDEVDYFDRNRGCPKFHLGSILKMVKVNHRGYESLAAKLCLRVFQALTLNLTGKFPAAESEVPFNTFMHQIMSDRTFEDLEARESTVKIIEEASCDALFFGLKNIYESLARTGLSIDPITGKDDLFDDMLFFVNTLYEDQLNFHRMMRIVRNCDSPVERFTIPVWTGTGIRNIRAAIVMSDNPAAHTVMRYNGAVITIVKNSRGNVTVQGDQEFALSQNLIETLDEGIVELGAMCRYGDLSPEQQAQADWEMLRCRGDSLADVGHFWHISDGSSNTDPENGNGKAWLSLYNGTHNHSAPPTKLTLGQLKNNAECAFTRNRRNEWKSRMRVPGAEEPDRKPSVQPIDAETKALVESIFGR